MNILNALEEEAHDAPPKFSNPLSPPPMMLSTTSRQKQIPSS
jgi:hypothetical protein